MEIYQIKHFVAIVETGSFTKGADRAAVTQSTISISIAKLEAEFGVELLERRSPVVPTSAGERLVEVGKAILQLCSVVKGVPLQSPRFEAAWFFPARQPPWLSKCSMESMNS
jgi:DNA-binding transcriptional LysR family regulator